MGTIKWELHIIAGAAAMGRQPGEVKGLPHHPATPSWAQVWIAKLPGHPLGPGARVVPRTHSALDHRGPGAIRALAVKGVKGPWLWRVRGPRSWALGGPRSESPGGIQDPGPHGDPTSKVLGDLGPRTLGYSGPGPTGKPWASPW